MSEYAWFKLLVRAIGVFYLATAIPSVLSSIWSSVQYWMEVGTDMYGFIAGSVYWVSQLGIALYLLLGGRRLIDFCLRDLKRCCPNCGYPTEGLTGPSCPECGARIGRSHAAAGTAEPSAPTLD